MKKLWCALIAIAGILLLAACGGTPKTLSAEVDTSDEVTVDWQGRNVGVTAPPDWVRYVATQDPDNQLSGLPRLAGKISIPMLNKAANLAIVESWVQSQAYGQAAQRIKTKASVEGSGGLEGDLQDAEATTVVKEFNARFAEATITGLNREMGSWVKTRSKSKGTEEYTYYAVYAISKEDLKNSINQTLGLVEAKTQKQQEMKAKLQAQMDRLVDSGSF